MNNSKKRVMILGAGQLQVPILEKAKERGYEIVVVSPDTNQPGIPYADYVVKADVRDKETILDAARKFRIDGITTDQTDLPVRTAAYVAEKMGLHGIGYKTGCLFTDKYAQREKCVELGIPSPRFALACTLEEARERINYIGFPVIIKPIDSQSSSGVALINNEEELEEKYRNAVKYSRSRNVIIEQFIDGVELVAECYVINGRITLMSAGEYHPFSDENNFSSHETLWPADQPESVIHLLEKTNRKVIRGFGLRNGRTHGEYIISGHKCFLVEIGARGGGSFFSSDTVRFVSGISTEDFLLDFAVEKKVHLTYSEERHKCSSTLFFVLPQNGVVTKIEGVEEVINLPYTRRNNLERIYEGMKTDSIESKGARFFTVVVAESYEELARREANIQSILKIVTEVDGREEMPIWN